MGDDLAPLPEPAALALVTAAAGAAGPCPADPIGAQRWGARVNELAVEMYRMVPTVAQRCGRLAAAEPVMGVIVSVEERSGRGLINIRPTMGRDQTKLEDFRTPFLNEPRGRAMFDLARALVGHHCRFGKVMEAFSTDEGAKKMRLCEWIEDLGADPNAPATPRPAARPAQHRPAHSQPPTHHHAGAPAGEGAPAVGSAALRAMNPTTLRELFDLADEHLDISADAVTAMAVQKWGHHEGFQVTNLKGNQLTILWNHLINAHCRVAA